MDQMKKLKAVIHCLPKEVEQINQGTVMDFQDVYLSEDGPTSFSGYFNFRLAPATATRTYGSRSTSAASQTQFQHFS